ncbi:unnamed protein product [Mytilus coruscus]|uniref:COR domain-containing protein n=1 Tax=Mytilus coruscus TaxID=42192 RepID=A0A6J8BLM9_MYTCO|nr:unnamed protein product [Mytilus coruscus]
MLAGEQGTGKTTIARYLVEKQPTRIRMSTDGIELYNGLSYMDYEENVWLGGKQDFSLEEIIISRSLLKEDETTKSCKIQDKTPINHKQITKTQYSGDMYRSGLQDSPLGRLDFEEKSADGFNYQNEIIVHDNQTGRESTDSSNNRHICETLESGFPGNRHTHIVTKPGLIRRLKTFFGVTKKVGEVKVSITKEKLLKMSSKVGRKKLQSKKIAPIIIWDFGGQDVFYSTHQTFLTYRAIYMIVLDGSRQLDDPCIGDQYLPGKTGQKTARDYLRFWINTIVTYCKGSIQGFPKIMVVLTHKDKNEVDNQRLGLFAEIRELFAPTPLMQHLVIDDQIFVNAKDKHDPEMQKIKDVIISESEKQPTWGESLPKCFIPLELEFASLIRRNTPLITIEHLQTINSAQPIRPLSETELKVFLKFQHSIGKILYFDEHKLDKHVILSPTFLIDAFKSIVTERSFCEGDKNEKSFWKKKKYHTFYKDKDYLLEVMTHLDILVEPKRYNLDHKRIPADFYYIASMVRAIDDTGYLQSARFTQRSIAIAFQSSSLIPPALSFRFLSYCLSVWAVKTYGDNKAMLFHRSGVFTIDPSLDMYIICEDETIIARLVHASKNVLIMRCLASSINECLTSALKKISQLYIRTSSDHEQTSDSSFITKICCNSPDNPCILEHDKDNKLEHWICPSHGIEHKMHTITAWFPEKDEAPCEPACPVTNEEFLKERPTDLHLRRLALLYTINEIRELAIQLGFQVADLENISYTADPVIWKFEVVRKCRDRFSLTFKHIRDASEIGQIQNIHILCKLVKGAPTDFDREPEKWDLVLTEEYIDRLAPLIGDNSLQFLIELEMGFHTWNG